MILEARGDIGGTWDLFRYPGIRSDSDMFTLGYSKQGSKLPWHVPQNYVVDLLAMKLGAVDDDAMRFSTGVRSLRREVVKAERPGQADEPVAGAP